MDLEAMLKRDWSDVEAIIQANYCPEFKAIFQNLNTDTWTALQAAFGITFKNGVFSINANFEQWWENFHKVYEIDKLGSTVIEQFLQAMLNRKL